MNRWIEKALRLARICDGSIMIEFALGSGVLLAAFTGTFQFGYTFLQYNNLANAVARGARYASLVPYDSATTTPSGAFQTAVQNMVLCGSPDACAAPVLAGLTADKVILAVTFTNGVPSAMTVSINGYAINSVFAATTLTSKPQVTYAYQGIWAPV